MEAVKPSSEANKKVHVSDMTIKYNKEDSLRKIELIYSIILCRMNGQDTKMYIDIGQELLVVKETHHITMEGYFFVHLVHEYTKSF